MLFIQLEPPIPAPVKVRLYDLSSPERRALLLKWLKRSQTGPRFELKIGCAEFSEAACTAAGEFLVVFSEAEWKIQDKQVFRMHPQIPRVGITIATRLNRKEIQKLDDLPPHLGIYTKLNSSSI